MDRAYESALISAGFELQDAYPNGQTNWNLVEEGRIGLSVGGCPTVSAYCFPREGSVVIGCEPKWNVNPEEIESIKPDLIAWAISEMEKFEVFAAQLARRGA